MQNIFSMLGQFFPEWEIHHTGGGMFLIRKDFESKDGENIMVAVSEDTALIMKEKNGEGYISCSEFNANEDIYWGEGAYNLEYPVVEKRGDGEVVILDKASIFNEKVLNEIKDTIIRLEKIIWGTF